jgi:hypothetical protein
MSKSGSPVPLVSDVSHEQRTSELNAATWKPGAILKVARIDFRQTQRFHLPGLCEKRNPVEVLALQFAWLPTQRIS